RCVSEGTPEYQDPPLGTRELQPSALHPARSLPLRATPEWTLIPEMPPATNLARKPAPVPAQTLVRLQPPSRARQSDPATSDARHDATRSPDRNSRDAAPGAHPTL